LSHASQKIVFGVIMKKPTGLKTPGSALWEQVTDAYELAPDELPVLEHAARTADELARLQRELASAPATVEGSTGQVRTHPLFAEVRAHRALLAKLVESLGLPAPEPEVGPSAASQRASHAAQARWAAPRPPARRQPPKSPRNTHKRTGA
jgi:hypothetical protein